MVATQDTRGTLLSRCAQAANRVRQALPRPMRWVLDRPQRLLVLAWLVGLLIVGSARMGLADEIIVGPDLAHGGPRTLFEQYDMWAYKLTTKPDDAHSDWLGVSQGLLQTIGVINYLFLWLCLGLLYGGLTLLEWFLNLSIYHDSAGQIDMAVRMMADHVFWPLISATVAIGAFLAYAKWRADGRGFLSDLGWVVAAASLAMAFAAGPSTIMGSVDSVRQDLGSGVVAGAAQFEHTGGNPVGYPSPPLSGSGKDVSTRQLVDSMWSTFGASTWCFAEFDSLQVCRHAGSHALANDATWQGWMAQLDAGQHPAVFGDKADYIRGQDPARMGVLLMMALVVIPLAVMLLWLVISGLNAVVGLLLMLVIGMLFLVLWPIDGIPRRIGTQYWTYTLGLELQGLFITVVTSGIMVVSTILGTQVGRYGFFLVALLNVALLYAAVKARSWLETLTTVGGARSSGLATMLVARSVTRTLTKAVAGAMTGGTTAAVGAAGAAAARGLGGRQSWQSARNWASLRYGGNGRSGMAATDSGPVQATATRMRPPRPNSQLGSPHGLPAGPSGSPTPAPSSPGPSGPHGRAGGNGRSGTATMPRTADEVRDGTVQRNAAQAQAQTGTRGRVWVSPPGGRNIAPLSPTPPPAAKQQRNGVSQITSARWPRRRGPRRTDQ